MDKFGKILIVNVRLTYGLEIKRYYNDQWHGRWKTGWWGYKSTGNTPYRCS